LKGGDANTIQRMMTQLRTEAENIIESIIELSWYMRGGIQYKDMMNMTPAERSLVRHFIENRLEKIKDSSHPVY
jgi:hypothetical protein